MRHHACRSCLECTPASHGIQSGYRPLYNVAHRVYPRIMKTSRSSSQPRLVARGVRPDSRKRVALGRALEDLGEASFDVYREATGRIILDPRVSIPASEVWLFRNRKAAASVRRGLEEAAEGKARTAGSFARFADDDE